MPVSVLDKIKVFTRGFRKQLAGSDEEVYKCLKQRVGSNTISNEFLQPSRCLNDDRGTFIVEEFLKPG